MSDLRRLLFANQTRAYEGYPLVISRSVALRYLKQYQMYGNSEQGVPAGYTPLEYIQSTGTQYIDTGISINEDSKVDILYSMTSITSDSEMPFGTRISGSSSDAMNGIFRTHGFSTNRIAFGKGSGTNVVIQDYNSSNTNYNLVIDKNGAVINGTAVTTFPTSTITNTYPMYIFACNTSGTASFITAMKLYSFKLYNNTLVRNFIPAKRNSDSVIGMYDTVSGQFFTNAGTGTFTAGPALPTPENPVDIISVGDKTVNLFDMSDDNIELGKYIDNSGVVQTNASNFYNKKHISVVGGGTYTLSVSSGIRYASVMEYDAGGVFIKRTLWGEASSSSRFTEQTITLEANTATVLIGSNVDTAPITLERIHEIDWQFELGSTATSYVPYGYQIPVTAQGKNLFDITADDWGAGYVQPNTVYTFSFTKGSSTRTTIYEVSNSEESTQVWTESSSGELGTKVVTFTTGANASYIRLNSKSTITFGDAQLEKGSTATSYVPYGHSTTPIYLNAPLRKVGNYADVLDYKKGQIIRNVGVKVLDGTENIGQSGVYAGSFFVRNVVSDWGTSNNAQVYCSHFSGVTTGTDYAQNKCMILNNAFNMWWASDSTPTVAQFQQWLATQYANGTPVIIYYPLATPVTESIVAPALPTMAGSTTYTTETEVKPSNMKGVF